MKTFNHYGKELGFKRAFEQLSEQFGTKKVYECLGDGIKRLATSEIKNYNRTKERDLFRNQWAAAHNIPLVRIPYWEKDNITLEMLMDSKYEVK